ncbi:2Fe-2S iron-sulfur cluster-binding protein [Solimonas terrae]|uniref:2Fe-2S iron-sulfur cluster binding domain-containing protein n=1 Tax=Solimonas terrae TaxID=1396819 RepID=A0A6M2BQW4_9GAMM|nr:2Fe-2S iron-sulfur cluster-binding protein [Solimonas terrae]NGY04868.1 2Fe-2S iron-sulfur cluster binding domain-containing protein [Solimonas terrae]
MVAITFIEDNGTRHQVDAEPGTNLMEAATLNMVPGVLGMCGGICSCATCHCYVGDDWRAQAGAPAEGELQMLDAVTHRRPGSRLGCQVIVSEAMDGITITLPPDQDAG